MIILFSSNKETLLTYPTHPISQTSHIRYIPYSIHPISHTSHIPYREWEGGGWDNDTLLPQQGNSPPMSRNIRPKFQADTDSQTIMIKLFSTEILSLSREF